MISSTTSRVAYTLSSTTETLAVPFYFLENSHLKVIKTVAGVQTTLTLGTHYSVSGAGVLAGGSITMTGTGVATGNGITIKRSVPFTQLVDYVANSAFPADTHEKALDKLTMLCQFLQDQGERSLRFEDGETLDGTLELADRKDKVPAFNATTGALEFIDRANQVEAAASAAAAAESAAIALSAEILTATPDIDDVYRMQPDLAPKFGDNVDEARNNLGLVPAFLNQTGTLTAIGDSNTYGSNNATGEDYASATRLLAAYRWVDMLATRDQRALSIANIAIGGSRVSWKDSANFYDQWSQFNAFGQVDYNWTGVLAMMPGWNNTSSSTTGDDFYAAMRRAFEALVGRALIDDYGAISINGWMRSGTSDIISGWSNTGSNNQYLYGTSADRRKVMPFYFGDSSAARYRIDLDGTDYLQFTLTNKQSAALFFDTSSDGGAFTVRVNGQQVFAGTTAYAAPSAGDQYPFMVWLDDLPASAVVRVTSAVGAGEHVYWLGCGWNDINTGKAVDRTIIVGSVIANTTSSRAVSMLQAVAQQSRAAVATFADYPVFWADVFNSWVQATDSEPQDTSHFTPSGGEHVYSAFRNAYRLSREASPNRISVMDVIAREFFVGLTTAGMYRTGVTEALGTLYGKNTAFGGIEIGYKLIPRNDGGVMLKNTRADGQGKLLFGTANSDTAKVGVGYSGGLLIDLTNTTGGTTGAQTINKGAGSVNFAAGATSLVVTNSLVTTSSLVRVWIQTNDATMKSVVAVPASGSFTVYANAAPTAETRVGFEVINTV